MAKTNVARILIAVPALLACTGMLQATPASPLTVSTSTVNVTYTKPGTPGNGTNVIVSSTAGTGATAQFFTVDLSTVPVWLTVGTLSGTAPLAPATGLSVNFVANAVSASLSSGSYTSVVHFLVANYLDQTVTVNLVVKNPPAVLSVKETTPLTANWSLGNLTLPTLKLTSTSNGDPIAFTVGVVSSYPTSPANFIQVDHKSGVAYSFAGTVITLTFLPQVYQSVNVGDVITGTVTLTPTTGSPLVIPIAVTVTPPTANITSILPSVTSVAPGAPLQVILQGSNFVKSPPSEKTVITVQIGSGSVDTLDTSVVNVVSSTTLIVTLDDTTYLAAAHTLNFTAANSTGSPATIAMTVTTNPIITSMVNGASFMQPATGVAPNEAPYELVSIFGDNFGPLATDDPVVATVDGNSRFPAALATNGHNVTVTFYQSDGSTPIADAYLLLATKNQINALVPSGATGTMKVKVSYNGASSTAYTVTGVSADPGIFTTASSGQGQAAVFNADGSVNSATNKATRGTTVSMYLTGLGAPTSTAANTAAPAAVGAAGCMSLASYFASANTANSTSWTSDDGAVLLSSLILTNYAPCFTGTSTTALTAAGNVSVTIGGTVATVTYAGFVKDSVAGLYQINFTIPSGLTVPAAANGNPTGTVPLVVGVGTGSATVKSTLTGVTMMIQ